MSFTNVPYVLHLVLNIISYLFNCWGLSERWHSVRPGNIGDVEIQSVCIHTHCGNKPDIMNNEVDCLGLRVAG